MLKLFFSRLKWVVGVKNAILFKQILINMFINSLKGKFSMCPIELIHPKRASLKDNILLDKVMVAYRECIYIGVNSTSIL